MTITTCKDCKHSCAPQPHQRNMLPDGWLWCQRINEWDGYMPAGEHKALVRANDWGNLIVDPEFFCYHGEAK